MPSSTSLIVNGPFAARRDGRPVRFAVRGPARLLAYLALAGPTERARAASDLWPEVDLPRALASLRQALRRLALAAGEGWIVADRVSLRLHEAVRVEPGEGPLLEGWEEPWIARFRPAPVDIPPLGELFSLLAWYRNCAPATALALAAESFSLIEVTPPSHIVCELAPLLTAFDRLPAGTGRLGSLVARAHYLLGDMERAFALNRRIEREFPERAHVERLAQVVVLRESGRARAACLKAEEARALCPRVPASEQEARYHLGYTRYLAGERDGLDAAQTGVEALIGIEDQHPLGRLFPTLNVAEGLLDSGRPATAGLLLRACAPSLAMTDDRLAHLAFEVLQSAMLAPDAPEIALERLGNLERRAWEARLVPFAASIVDRSAALAYRIGRLKEAQRLVVRGDGIRKRLGTRRNPVERTRLAPLRALG